MLFTSDLQHFVFYSYVLSTIVCRSYYKILSYVSGLKDFVLHEHVERNPNLQILAETLTEFVINRGGTSRGIIFVRTRALAEALSSWLNRCEIQDLRNLNAHSFTGSNASVLLGG